MYKCGDVVGKYTIIEGGKIKGNIKYYVRCNDCDMHKNVFYNALHSCRHCKPRLRHCIDRGEYVELQLTGGEYTKIDKFIYNTVKDYCWYKSKRNSVEARIGNKLIKLHRYIKSPYKDSVVDHINGDTLDNRIDNLRICTQQENTFNSKPSKSSKTGIKGVWFDNKCGKYGVQITVDKKRYWGGYFKELKDAVDKVNYLTKTLHGEFAKQQFLNE